MGQSGKNVFDFIRISIYNGRKRQKKTTFWGKRARGADNGSRDQRVYGVSVPGKAGFKKYTDVSPAQYMSHLRFLKAKEMLESTDLTMAEIAFSLNFDSPSHFASFFRKMAAATPSQYRCRFRNSTNGNDTP